MANDLTGSVHIVDTAATISTGPVIIDHITWKAPTTAGNDLKITDGNDKVIFEGKASVVGANVIGKVPDIDNYRANGLKVATIDAGTLYIYYN